MEPVGQTSESVLNPSLQVNCHHLWCPKHLNPGGEEDLLQGISGLVFHSNCDVVGGGMIDDGQELVLLSVDVVSEQHVHSNVAELQKLWF